MLNKVLALFLVAMAAASVAHADKARLIVSDVEAMQVRIDLLQNAKEEILIEYFSVWNDDQSISIMTLLMDAARRGVKVKVILDSLASKVPYPTYSALLDRSMDQQGNRNLEMKLYNPFRLNVSTVTYRDHAKMIIVDGKVLLTGGRNIGDKYFGFNSKSNYIDLDILVSGHLVQDARKNFLETWATNLVKLPYINVYAEDKLAPDACILQNDFEGCENKRKFALSQVSAEETRLTTALAKVIADNKRTGHPTNKDWLAESAPIDGNRMMFLSHATDRFVSKETAHLTSKTIELLRSAKSEVFIVSPYFIPPKDLMDTFRYLIQKNVKVHVITNSISSTDNLKAYAGYDYLRAELIEMGVELEEYMGPNTLHAKTALIDDELVMVGTNNMDSRSAYINREVALAISDENGVLSSDLRKVIETFRKDSLLVAKDGKEQNLEIQRKNRSAARVAKIKALQPLVPLFIHQL